MWAKLGHSKPITRRDLLASGAISFTASLFIPQWVSMLLGHRGFAATDPSGSNSAVCPVPEKLISLVTVNLQGGAALASNFVPMNQQREPIASYNKLGLGNNQVPIEREFGNVPFAGKDTQGNLISKFLEGIRSRAAAGTIANTAFIGIPCESANDTNSNRLDISGLVSKAGLIGTNLPNLGRINSPTGINQMPALVAPAAPLIVGSFDDLKNSLGYSASLQGALNVKQKASMVKLLSQLNRQQMESILPYKNGKSTADLIDCAGIKNISVSESGTNLVDPRINNDFATVWGITNATASNNADLIFGSMVYNSLLGQAGAANINLGGYDYHDATRATGDTRDLAAGQLVGRILQSAAVLKQPVFIYVTSDGSVSSPVSEARNAPWVGDRSNAVLYVLFYDPKGRPATSDFQIGAFNDTQSVDTKFFTGANPELAAAAVFANWCQANKRMELFEKVLTRTLSTEQLSQVVKFG